MSDPITPEIFSKLVELAALELAPEEGEYIRQQLNNQLKAIEELRAIPVDTSLPANLHGLPYPPQIIPPLRGDDWQPMSDPAKILAQAPETAENYIVVPDIPHTKLD
jgi:aspartyl-tRNA(Asn)/glutamyl-tRNA(Gln) amidotransferase subunit C